MLVAVAMFGWSESIVLTIDGAVELAIENNADLENARIDVLGAARRADSAWNVFLPSISVSTSLNHTASAFSDPFIPRDGWTFSGAVNVSLPLQASLPEQIKATQLALEAQEISYEQARLYLQVQVEREFAYLLVARSNVNLLATSLDLAEQRYEQTRILYENGRASELSMLQAQVSAANQRPTYLQAVADYEERLRTFLIVLGLDPTTEIELTGAVEPSEMALDADRLASELLENRPDIQSLRTQVETLENTLRLSSRSQRLPTLALSAGWNTSVPDPFTGDSWRNTTMTGPGTWTDAATVGVSVSVPIDSWIPGSGADVALDSTADAVEQAQNRLMYSLDSARTEIANLVAELETAWITMEESKVNVELSQTAYDLSEEAYRRGTVDRLSVEDSQQSYLSAQQTLLFNQYSYYSGLLSLKLALGVDSIEQIPTL